MRNPTRNFAVLAAVLSIFSTTEVAQAFSVRVHIHLANTIRDDLLKNWDETGQPVVRLLGPDGAQPTFVRIPLRDAEAIRDNPEYWRGGAIGPDNTVFPALTDPSHGFHYMPYAQCQELVEWSETPAERAYALGCYLHGITDNAAHHLVNYLTGETFTMFPVEGAVDGHLEFSLINVVRHMTVESKFEDSLGRAQPEAFRQEKLRHKVAKALVRRVYLTGTEGEEFGSVWRWAAGELVGRKNQFLREGLVQTYRPEELARLSDADLEEKIRADISEYGTALRIDRRVIDAYVLFFQSGGVINGLASTGGVVLNGMASEPGAMTPADYVLFLPEVVSDFKRFLRIAQLEGEAVRDGLRAEIQRTSCWRHPVHCTALKAKSKVFDYLFTPQGGGASRFARAVDRKSQELDAVLMAYVQSVENFSNLLVVKGVGSLSLHEIAVAFEPIAFAIDQLTDFPYDLLFPSWVTAVIDSVQSLRDLCTRLVSALKEEIKTIILNQARVYIEQLRAQIQALRTAALNAIDTRILETVEALRTAVGQAKLAAMGLELSSAEAILTDFPHSVLYMNSYNSAVGVLGNSDIVFGESRNRYSGPLSFDASFQLEWNQLALCDDLAPSFYPCGRSAGDMLQPDYRRCSPLDPEAHINPPTECHANEVTRFAENPDPSDPYICEPVSLNEFVSGVNGASGSYSMSFPPANAPIGAGNEQLTPVCAGLVMPGVNASINTIIDKSEYGYHTGSEASGPRFACSTSPSTPGSSGLLGVVFWALIALGLRRRRVA